MFAIPLRTRGDFWLGRFLAFELTGVYHHDNRRGWLFWDCPGMAGLFSFRSLGCVMAWKRIDQSRSISGPVIRLDVKQSRFAINVDASRLFPGNDDLFAIAYLEPEKQVVCLSLQKRYTAGCLKICRPNGRKQRIFRHTELCRQILETGGQVVGESVLLTHLPNPKGSPSELLFTYRTEDYGQTNVST